MKIGVIMNILRAGSVRRIFYTRNESGNCPRGSQGGVYCVRGVWGDGSILYIYIQGVFIKKIY